MKPFYISTTRFTNETYNENKTWRERNNWKGCVYAVPIEIAITIPQLSKIFVLEMNNSINKIMGIGLIRNKVRYDLKYKIHRDNNYNRYIYRSYYRIEREKCDPKYLLLLEKMVFKGKAHLKRGYGFTTIPIKWIIKNKRLPAIPMPPTFFTNIIEEYANQGYKAKEIILQLELDQHKLLKYFNNLFR